jgi:hypothetical protein
MWESMRGRWRGWNSPFRDRRSHIEEELFNDTLDADLTPTFLEDATFVWIYWHGGAQDDEIRWSMRSVLAKFHGNASILVVGDPPPWYSGPAMRIKRVADCRMQRYRDQLNKLYAVCTSESVPEEFVWMMDDTYFLRRVTLTDLRRHFHHPSIVQGSGEWARHKRSTFDELARRGLPQIDYCTHMPHVLNKKKFLETWERYDLGQKPLAWELLYGADHWHEREPIDLRIFARVNKPHQRPDAAIWNNGDNGWGESLRRFLQSRFPERTPFECINLKPLRQDIRMRTGLADLIAHLPKGPLEMAEVGCYGGESSEIFAASGKFQAIHCVDCWNTIMAGGYVTADAEPAFDAVAARFPDILKKHKAISVEAARGFPDATLDLVYIDAAHDYRSVQSDIHAWTPKVKPGGFVAGHDYTPKTPGVIQAVRESFAQPMTLFADGSWMVRVASQSA